METRFTRMDGVLRIITLKGQMCKFLISYMGKRIDPRLFLTKGLSRLYGMLYLDRQVKNKVSKSYAFLCFF